jgi:hypothetical protein
MSSLIAILEDDPDRLVKMRDCISRLMPGAQQSYFDSASNMISWLSGHLGEIDLISLDHDLPLEGNHGTGRQVADYLATRSPVCPVIVHTSNEFFSPGMLQVLTDAGWPVFRVYPHGDLDWVNLGWADQIRRLIKRGWMIG